MTATRAGLIGVIVVAAVVAQVTLFSLVSVDGVVPDLALLVVVAASVARGARFGAVVGFVSGLVLDLAPPSDHVAGRWALALVLVAALAARVRDDARRSPLAGLAAVGMCAFVGISVFALTGLVLGDHASAGSTGQVLGVIGIGVLWDVALAPLLLPPLMLLFERPRSVAELA